jgi:hypothetical protein
MRDEMGSGIGGRGWDSEVVFVGETSSVCEGMSVGEGTKIGEGVGDGDESLEVTSRRG